MRAQLQHIQPEASIINTSSAAGLTGFVGGTAYTASKHAVSGLTRSAAKGVGSKKIRVNAVAPGYVVTPMTDKAAAIIGLSLGAMGPIKASALGRIGRAEEVAKLAVLLLGDDASYMTGTVIPIDGDLIC
ncbi:hypothetical protein CDV36_012988 [Fusarium kuroshium]|uniref:3-oxoacyl-[acyl-carrier-protein] reductase FabG n=2 Tax=Fusarium solani species complex TaxID=232080 RepID=A0A3M2RQ78_9HYPO|nr:hypothetical protein CDV36_012988 [Fusarium kuroshium]RSL92400.1 hypothetical protein CEP52_013831 [Fusarium oligoseptatum]